MSSLNDLVKTATEDSERWFPDTASQLDFMALALAGEVGEVANIIKKVMRGTDDFDKVLDDLEEEVTDVFIYLMCLAGVLGMDLEAAYAAKRAKNEERFGNRDRD